MAVTSLVPIKRMHVILNVTHGCNLACHYCYYAPEMSKKQAHMHMSLDTVEHIFKKLADSEAQSFEFSIHGGEPLLREPEYYKSLFALQRKYLNGRIETNALQTNGTLMNDEFIDAFQQIESEGSKLSIGVSLDGPEEVHDRARPYRRKNAGSFKDVMRGIELLDKRGIPIGLLAVAPLHFGGSGGDLYAFYKALPNVQHFDLLVPSADAYPEVLPGVLARLYNGFFDAWFNDASPGFDVRFFSSIVSSLLTGKGTLCTFQKDCAVNGKMISITPSGDVSFCDSFPEVVLGDVWHNRVDELVSSRQRGRVRMARLEQKRTEGCLFCKWYGICHGGCPEQQLGNGRRPRFCADYAQIFEYVDRHLQEIGIEKDKGLAQTNLGRLSNPALVHLLKSRSRPKSGVSAALN